MLGQVQDVATLWAGQARGAEMAKTLDEQVAAFRNRPLGGGPFGWSGWTR